MSEREDRPENDEHRAAAMLVSSSLEILTTCNSLMDQIEAIFDNDFGPKFKRFHQHGLPIAQYGAREQGR